MSKLPYVSVSAQSLGALRLCLGVLSLWWFLQVFNEPEAFRNSGWLHVSDLEDHYPDVSGLTFILGLEPTLVASVGIVAVVLFLLNIHGRFSNVMLYMGILWCHLRNPFLCNGPDTYLRLLIFWSLFFPFSAAPICFLSEKSRHQVAIPLPSFAAYLLQICVLYWASALSKADSSWQHDLTAVAQALSVDSTRLPLGTAVSNCPNLLKLATWLTLRLEEIGPLFFILTYGFERMRVVCIGCFIFFHLFAIGLCIKVGIFPFVATAAWLLFLPGWVWRGGDCKGVGVAKVRPAKYYVSSSLALGAISVVVFWNIGTFNPNIYAKLINPCVRKCICCIGLNQSWHLFAPKASSAEIWFTVSCNSGGVHSSVNVGARPYNDAFRLDTRMMQNLFASRCPRCWKGFIENHFGSDIAVYGNVQECFPVMFKPRVFRIYPSSLLDEQKKIDWGKNEIFDD